MKNWWHKMVLYKDIVRKIPVSADKKIKQKQYLNNGLIPIIDQGQHVIAGYTDDLAKKIDCDYPVIVFGDHTRCVKLVNFPFAPGADGIKVIKPIDESVDIKYLFYATKYLASKIRDKGYARHYQDIEKQKLKVPPLQEQQLTVSKIEELFSSLNNAIETLNKTKEQLAVYSQAVLKEAFEGRFTIDWRTKHKSHIEQYEKLLRNKRYAEGNKTEYQLMERIDLPPLPKAWKWIYVGDIVTKPEYGTSKKSLKCGEIPVLRMGNMKKGIIDWNDLVYSDDKDDNEKYLLHDQDVLFNRSNSAEHVGKTSIFKGERSAIYAGYIIRVNQLKEINAQYLTYYMNSFIAKKYSNLVKTDGVNQSNINSQKLLSYPFPLCSREEQDVIVNEIEKRLSLYDNIEQTIDISLEQADAMRQSILKEAFEGRLV